MRTSKHIKYISVEKAWGKIAGLGIYVGWDRYPRVLILTIGQWAIFLGPHK
ncbi:MAG: hypothetical protein Q7J27_07895 [Syntrophales bacterium]|nr:hypothetical protein [Syntrophales bacterium]